MRPLNPGFCGNYRKHAPSGQAVCTVRQPDDRRQDLYLGRHDTAASRAEFKWVLAVVEADGGVYPSAGCDMTVAECLVRYVKHIDGYYRHPDGTPTGTATDIKVALGYLKRLSGPHPIADFGVPALKAVREAMVTDGRVRNQVNKRVSMIRSFVRWCVEERLAPAVVLTELNAVRPLAAGRCGAVEGKAVQPADPATVEKAVPFMPPAVRAIVKLLRLTGARPTELMTMRPRDLGRAGDTWAYTVSRHKGSWRGKPRLIHLGPEARAVLSPSLDGCDPDG